MQLTERPAQLVRFGVYEVDLRSGELRKNGLKLRLSGQPFQVLALLLERAGDIVTRDDIQKRLWPADTFVDFDHGLNTAINKIREVLGDAADSPRFVETLPRRGYRFIAPLADVRPAVAPSTTESRPSQLDKVDALDAASFSVLPAEKRVVSTRLILLVGGAVVLVLVALALRVYRSSTTKVKRQPAIKSLAVLPLNNLSGDSTQEYLADGMTEAIIGRLSGIHELRVISRTSVMGFKHTQLLVPEIAKMLNVDAIVEGSVVREGTRVRVYAQLIRAATDEHLWSETYDREMGDVLPLQSEIAQSIAEKVRVTFAGKEHSRLVAARHVSPEVYESYLKGNFGKDNSRAEIEQSITYFQKAIRQDPTFAPAYAGLGRAYGNLGTIIIGAPPTEVRPKVISAARKALELDPGLAEAHVVLAGAYQRQWQWSEAQAEYERALELSPNDAAAHLRFAEWLVCQGRTDEALAWSQRARELDPLGTAGSDVGWILFHARRYDEAIGELRSVLSVHPDDGPAHLTLAFALIGKGQADEAIPDLEKTASMMRRSPGSVELLATAYAHAGRRPEALRLLDELKRRRQAGYIPAGAFINPYLGLGDYNEAFAWFERAYQEQSNILQFLKVHPFFDPVREDPRFADLVRRVGLS